MHVSIDPFIGVFDSDLTTFLMVACVEAIKMIYAEKLIITIICKAVLLSKITKSRRLDLSYF